MSSQERILDCAHGGTFSLLWLDGQDMEDPSTDTGENNVWGRVVCIDLYDWAKGEKIFVFHVNSHQKISQQRESQQSSRQDNPFFGQSASLQPSLP